MIIADLLSEDTLQLRLHTPSSSERLAREISWCAPAETIDPTPFLSRNVLLLTNGIGLNIEDDRTWSAYVERLVSVQVAAVAFGTGFAHHLIPPGLVRAAADHDLPLLEIPRSVPFLQVHRHVTNVLQSERFTAITRSWELAQACAGLASSGARLSVILDAVAAAVRGEVAIADAVGTVIARSPERSAWSQEDLEVAASAGMDATVPLPMGTGDSFQLVVRGAEVEHPISTLLAPVASIIAVQLQTALLTTTSKQSELVTLLDQVADWSGVALEQFAETVRSTGLLNDEATVVIAARTGHGTLSDAWKTRLMLQSAFDVVRVQVRGGTLFAFAQQPHATGPQTNTLEPLLSWFMKEMPDQAVVLKGPCASSDELRLGVYQAQDLLAAAKGPTIAPELGISALIASTATHGARAGARRLLAPVVAYDATHSLALLDTLECFLAHDAQPSRAAASLYIHRNTLSQRIGKLEGLLKLSLSTLEGQATCLMALRILKN
ncbi:PucR family transcriptional regulator [Arthrobacter sp. 260]|uniref:PucR family transcriptional regulator n=1 Tax=Arthrobacter sp. 260 TaxID=2735314 RepID=UPI001490D8ED|nr:PucR family transcriptional regulator [Arthrobacter sp. 260]NOJ60039.1 PucR family transcriptional regulator [Arthrobacter sp. 260]